jgi:3-hydroxy-3-methylglutaryl CoA synthase/uncharacterized OB-fold protein
VTGSTRPGIERLGVHVPRWSLDRQELAKNWSATSGPGRRTVANYDEDSLTMGVEAALDALGPDPADRDDIDAVLFATTTPVFTEKQHAVVVAAALELPTAQCYDVTGSLRSGLDAVRLASALIEAGTARRVLVVAADRRDLQPGGPHERLSGDAGAAVVIGPVVGTGPGLMSLTAQVCVGDPGAGIWRAPAGVWSNIADDRFVSTELLTPWLVEAAQAALGSDQPVAAGFASPLARVEKSVMSALRLTVDSPSTLLDSDIGYCGVAHPFLQLALALEGRAVGEQVLIAAAGDGAAATLCTVTDGESAGQAAAAIRTALAHRRDLPVGMYQRMRGQLPVEPVSPYTSEMLLRREQSTGLALHGTRCSKCGRAHFPGRRVCLGCKALDSMETLRLPRAGTLFTHTVEHLFPVPVNQLIMGVVEVDEVRVYTQVTDSDPDECAPGRPVRLVLRRLHDGGNLPHYFWKAKVAHS